MPIGGNQVLIDQPGHLEGHVIIISGPQYVESLFLPLRKVARPGQQRPTVFVQRVVFASAASGGLPLESLPASGELVGGQMDDMERIHDLGGVREDLVDCGGVAGEAVHRHDLHFFSKAGVAFLQPCPQHLRTAPWADVQQAGRPTAVHQWGEVDEDGHQVRRFRGSAGVFPHVLIDAEDADTVEVVRVVVDELAAGIQCDLVDQRPADAESFGGGGDTHSVDSEALQAPADDPVGELRTVICARQGGLEDLPVTGGIRAGEGGGTRTCRRVGNPTTGRSTSRRKMWSRLVPGREHSGQALLTATGVASMMVRFPASAALVIVRPISAVRQMVSATRLPLECTLGSWFGQMEAS